jgi:hypothetical protein
VTYLASVDRFKCDAKHPRAQFSLKVGTIFEDSPIGLDKWLPAVWLIVNCKNGISSYEVAQSWRHPKIGVVHDAPHPARVDPDPFRSYNDLAGDYQHKVSDHDEQAYRFNGRKLTDAERFALALLEGARPEGVHHAGRDVILAIRAVRTPQDHATVDLGGL